MTLRSALLASAMLAVPLATAGAQAIDGPYVAGGAGINFLQRESFERAPSGIATTSGTVKSDIGPAVVISLGWGFGNGLRAEVEASFRQNNGFSSPNGFGGGLTSISGSERKIGGMFNMLYDFTDLIPAVQPYVGIGLGYQSASLQNVTATGATTVSSDSKGSFAYQAIVGAALPIDALPGLALTAEYRFMGLAGNRGFGTNFGVTAGTLTSTDNFNHSVLLGFRFAFGAAPMAAAAPMPMADSGAKTFQVFFDHNQAELTSRSQGIIKDAATYSTKTQYTRIDIDGNADTSGAPGPNQALSERRARTVAGELVRNGVPQNSIQLRAFGDTKLLVPTGVGVREPQNRRVDIVFR